MTSLSSATDTKPGDKTAFVFPEVSLPTAESKAIASDSVWNVGNDHDHDYSSTFQQALSDDDVESLLKNSGLDVLNLPVDWQNQLNSLELEWLSENDLFSLDDDDDVSATTTIGGGQHIEVDVSSSSPPSFHSSSQVQLRHSATSSSFQTSTNDQTAFELMDSYSTPEVNELVASGPCWIVGSFDDLGVFSIST